MAAAPTGSSPGPVKLCVGECRPELRAQSSQLYSFVVSPRLKHIFFYPYGAKQESSIYSEIDGEDENWQQILTWSFQTAAIIDWRTDEIEQKTWRMFFVQQRLFKWEF